MRDLCIFMADCIHFEKIHVCKLDSFMIDERVKICDYMGPARDRSLLVFSIIILFSITFSPLKLINALPDYVRDLPASYGKGCQVCHVKASGDGALNNFGSDYSENDYDIEAIYKLDSDGDGHNNEKELKAGTFPGDPDSSPMQGIPGFPNESDILGITIVMILLMWRRG